MKNQYQAFIKSGLNSSFTTSHANFNAYVEHMRSIIETTRQDLTSENYETIIDANSPFEWYPDRIQAFSPKTNKIKNGVLLIHGLFDSPNVMLSLAEYFHNKDFLVRSLLLPGHGTNPGDLLGVTHDEWLKSVRFGISSFDGEVENLFICGFSTGGSLALHDCLHNNIPNLKGLILFAPALKLLTPISILSNIDKLLRSTNFRGIRWLLKAAKFDYAKYLAFTLESANEVHLLSHAIQKRLKNTPLDLPLFLVATEHDEVLSHQAMAKLVQQNKHPQTKMLLYGNPKNSIANHRIEVLSSYYPEKRILNFSHACLPVAPNHPHYGPKGDYHDFLIHEDSKEKHHKTLTEPPFLGAITRRNVRKHFLYKLTYNPDFENVTKQLTTWLKTIESDLK